MDFSSILSLGSSVATGGLAGGIFSILGLAVKSWTNYKELKEQNRHKERILELTNENLELEAKYRIEEKDLEIKEEYIKGELEVIKQGYKTDAIESSALAKIGGFFGKAALFYKATVRPTLSYLTTIFIMFVFYKIYVLIGGLEALDKKELLDIFKGLISTITGFWTAVGMYYFFNRPIYTEREAKG